MNQKPMNQPELLTRVVEIATSTVDAVDPSMLTLPTPRTEWNVRNLMNHMAITCRFAASVMDKTPPAEDRLADDDVLGDDFKAGFAAAAANAVRSFTAAGAMERIVDAPPGEVPGLVWIDFPTWDLYVHSWDLATATGVPMKQPDEVTEPVLAWGQQIFSGERNIEQLGHPIDVAGSAPAIERLVGFFGRTP